MKRILQIAAKDIRQILRDRLSLMFLLIMPAAFTLLFGFAFGGQAAPASQPVRVGFLDQDHSPESLQLRQLLAGSPAIQLEESGLTAAALEGRVASQDLAGAVLVPAGFGAGYAGPQALRLILVADPARAGGLAAQQAVQAASLRLASAAQAARLAARLGGADPHQALAQAAAAWQQPGLTLNLTSAAQAESGQAASAGGLTPSQTAPGMMLQFGIAGLLTAAQVLVHERKTRCLQRLLTTPASRPEILLGHFLAIFAVSLGQFLILIAFGQLVFKLDYLSQAPATLVMALASAVFIAALGLLIGALARSDDQAILFALIPMFVFAGLGGAWVPLETTGAAFQAVGHLTPVAWAMDGFKSVLSGSPDLASIGLPAAVLLGYAVLFFGLAILKFRFE